MKICSSCLIEKPALSFYKKTLSKDGLHSYCKECTSQKNKVWANNNKQRQAESRAKWYQKNRAKSIAKGTDWYYRNTHGISHEEFLESAEKQSNKCLICLVSLTFAEKQKLVLCKTTTMRQENYEEYFAMLVMSVLDTLERIKTHYSTQ